MVFHAGRPVDATENPAELGGGIGPDIYKNGNILYRVTNDKMCIYNLDKKTQYPKESEPEDERFLCSQMGSEDVYENVGSSRKLAFSPQTEPLAYWVECADGEVDRRAVLVSKDLDGGTLYVGRAYLLGCLLPGKVSVTHRVCYVALEGREYAIPKYEVLVVKGGTVTWVDCEDGYTPPNALPCGFTARGETVYSARAIVKQVITPGHFIAGEKESRMPYLQEEHLRSRYKILTVEKYPKHTMFKHGSSFNSSGEPQDKNVDDRTCDCKCLRGCCSLS